MPGVHSRPLLSVRSILGFDLPLPTSPPTSRSLSWTRITAADQRLLLRLFLDEANFDELQGMLEEKKDYTRLKRAVAATRSASLGSHYCREWLSKLHTLWRSLSTEQRHALIHRCAQFAGTKDDAESAEFTRNSSEAVHDDREEELSDVVERRERKRRREEKEEADGDTEDEDVGMDDDSQADVEVVEEKQRGPQEADDEDAVELTGLDTAELERRYVQEVDRMVVIYNAFEKDEDEWREKLARHQRRVAFAEKKLSDNQRRMQQWQQRALVLDDVLRELEKRRAAAQSQLDADKARTVAERAELQREKAGLERHLDVERKAINRFAEEQIQKRIREAVEPLQSLVRQLKEQLEQRTQQPRQVATTTRVGTIRISPSASAATAPPPPSSTGTGQPSAQPSTAARSSVSGPSPPSSPHSSSASPPLAHQPQGRISPPAPALPTAAPAASAAADTPSRALPGAVTFMAPTTARTSLTAPPPPPPASSPPRPSSATRPPALERA